MAPSPRRVDIAGRQLEIASLPGATPASPTLVFLHDGLGSLGQWRQFPAHVAADTGCPALVYSRAGYGRSERCPQPRDAEYLHREALAELPALLAAMAIVEPILIGHSDGATIALIHAAAGHPVSAIVAMAPHVLVEDVTLAGIRAAGRAWADADLRLRLARWHDDPDRVFHRWHDTWLDPQFRDWNIEALLPSIRGPTLLLQGREDEYGTLAQVDGIAARVRGPVETIALSPCGHAPWKDCARTVRAAIARFVAGHGLRATR